mmetsp:Transcript_29702/g.54461  ORF Transcript_29702/g.54461 Transcript_29702/m.54461 type:complete len:248 (-) Transcript_29702:69-812(-)
MAHSGFSHAAWIIAGSTLRLPLSPSRDSGSYVRWLQRRGGCCEKREVKALSRWCSRNCCRCCRLRPLGVRNPTWPAAWQTNLQSGRQFRGKPACTWMGVQRRGLFAAVEGAEMGEGSGEDSEEAKAKRVESNRRRRWGYLKVGGCGADAGASLPNGLHSTGSGSRVEIREAHSIGGEDRGVVVRSLHSPAVPRSTPTIRVPLCSPFCIPFALFHWSTRTNHRSTLASQWYWIRFLFWHFLLLDFVFP